MATGSERTEPGSREAGGNGPGGLFAVAYQQAWALCAAYLAVGFVAELARRGGSKLGISTQAFLDSLPIFAIHFSGFIEPYLRAVALGSLTPFWNRMLLSSITLVVILLQATLTALFLAGLMRLFGRRRG